MRFCKTLRKNTLRKKWGRLLSVLNRTFIYLFFFLLHSHCFLRLNNVTVEKIQLHSIFISDFLALQLKVKPPHSISILLLPSHTSFSWDTNKSIVRVQNITWMCICAWEIYMHIHIPNKAVHLWHLAQISTMFALPVYSPHALETEFKWSSKASGKILIEISFPMCLPITKDLVFAKMLANKIKSSFQIQLILSWLGGERHSGNSISKLFRTIVRNMNLANPVPYQTFDLRTF